MNYVQRIRREQAEGRLQIRSQRTPRGQWTELDYRLGEDLGASRERARLYVDMEEYE